MKALWAALLIAVAGCGGGVTVTPAECACEHSVCLCRHCAAPADAADRPGCTCRPPESP